MINSENLCMSCMKEIGSVEQCPYCGYHTDVTQIPPYLPVRSVVANRYLVGKLLEYNGDGATYMGWDMVQKTPVTVREFLPDAISQRKQRQTELTVMPGCEMTFQDCLDGFLELWQKLARLRGLSALISVIDIVEENGTAYAISEHVEGITLREYLLRSQTGYISWEKARSLLMPVLSTLGTLHTSGIIHRGISPRTLFIGRDGKMRIGGFSIWQARTARGDLTAQLFPGYSAIEQYGFEGQQGPWTDIYSFAAVLYRTLIGSDPIEANSRLTNDRLMVPGKFAEQLPAYVINGLVNALQILPEDRTRSVEQFRAELSASPVAAGAGADFNAPPVRPRSAPTPRPEKQQSPPVKKGISSDSKKTAIIAALISAAALFVVFLLVMLSTGGKLGGSGDITTQPGIVTEARMVTVPQFIGRYADEIKTTAVWSKNFTITYTEQYDDTVKKGIVIAQSLKSQTQVNAGVAITLIVSAGVENIPLPNVVNMQYIDAEKVLRDEGFKCSKIDKPNDGSNVAGLVYQMVQPADKAYPKGSEIVLIVWSEPETLPTETPVTDIPATNPPATVPPTTVPPATNAPATGGVTDISPEQ